MSVSPAEYPPIEVQAPHDRPRDIVDYARRRIRDVVRDQHPPVLHARVRIDHHHDPAAVAEPCTAQANLDVNGRTLRAQVSAPTAKQAVDRLHERLRWRLRNHSADPHHPSHGRRRGDRLEQRERHRPATTANDPSGATERPRVVRHKSVALHRYSVDLAQTDMTDMDYDFHLFTEVGTDQDSVLYRGGATGYRLAQIQPEPQSLASHELPVTISPQPAPLLDTDEAIERIAFLDEPFLFYLDGERGRGAVLYRRHDGDYGLITPAE